MNHLDRAETTAHQLESADATTINAPLTHSPTVHRLAAALTAAVFPLIWVGGLVTTYDAGMAVPDWPGTYGWNMFAYPASTWLFGPFDLLVEHSHRLLGTVAGFLSIGLVIFAFRYDHRRWFRIWSILVLLAVIAQGALGGARVVLDQRTFAMIHGCTGPLFFAMATATAVFSSRWWRAYSKAPAAASMSGTPAGNGKIGQLSTGARLAPLATILALTSYGQLILGAQLRHTTAAISHTTFMAFVHSHLLLASLVLLFSLGLVSLAWFRPAVAPAIRRPAAWLTAIVLLQLGLGIGTWIVNYALPWSELSPSLASYTIEAKGYWESLIVTAHMATGSLIISLATLITLRAWRVRHGERAVAIVP